MAFSGAPMSARLSMAYFVSTVGDDTFNGDGDQDTVSYA